MTVATDRMEKTALIKTLGASFSKDSKEATCLFLEFFLSFTSEVCYPHLFFRKSLIKNEKTPGAKPFTPSVLWRLEKN